MATAVRDVQTYHDSCSLVAGLVEVTSALDNRKKSRAEVGRDIKSLQTGIGAADQRFGALRWRHLQAIADLQGVSLVTADNPGAPDGST